MFGSFLREVRTSRGLTQAQVAAVSGISQPNLSAYEQDRRVPSASTLHVLLATCGYELAAVAGDVQVACPWPRIGWFPDDDLPPRLPDDPPDEAPILQSDSPWERRREHIHAVLSLVDAPQP